MLTAKNIGLSIGGKTLLNGIDFSCEPGQLIALCGPNGAGKSTLLKVLAGDLTPQQGQVCYNSHDIAQASAKDLAKTRAVMPQSLHVSFNLSALAVIEMGLLFCQSEQEQQSIVRDMAALLDIAHLLKRSYNGLSGGEQQRVQLARVIGQTQQKACSNTRFLLLDECTSAMDMAMMHKAFSVLRDIKQSNIGVVAVVHDLNLASLYADKIIMLKDGQGHSEGCPHSVITQSTINSVFQTSVEVISHPKHNKPVILQNVI